MAAVPHCIALSTSMCVIVRVHACVHAPLCVGLCVCVCARQMPGPAGRSVVQPMGAAPAVISSLPRVKFVSPNRERRRRSASNCSVPTTYVDDGEEQRLTAQNNSSCSSDGISGVNGSGNGNGNGSGAGAGGGTRVTAGGPNGREETVFESCVICLCDFEERETLVQLPCRHLFHERCITPWLRQNSVSC